jgi:hypothetical protein
LHALSFTFHIVSLVQFFKDGNGLFNLIATYMFIILLKI